MGGLTREDGEFELQKANNLSSKKDSSSDSKPKYDRGQNPKFLEQRGRFSRLSKEQRIAIARKGGSTPKKLYNKCHKCEIRFTCPRAYEDARLNKRPMDNSRCVYEMESKYDELDKNMKDVAAFVSADPSDLLTKIQITFKKLEAVVDKDPSYTKLTNMLYLMMNIYKMKFGEKAFIMRVNKNLDSGSPSLDIKSIMKEIRADERKKEDEDEGIIDVEPRDEGGPVP